MTKTEEIRHRTLSQREISKMDALAGKTEEHPHAGASTTLAGMPHAKTVAKEDVLATHTVEGLVRRYISIFPGNAAMVQAAIQMEGAVLIAKAIKDAKA